MKKIIALFLTLICMLSLPACESEKQTGLVVFSFSGENELFAISNGVIVLESEQEVFHGGNLEILQPELLSDITSYTTTFYTVINGEEKPILSNSMVNTIGSSVNVNRDLGQILGEKGLSSIDSENTDDLKNNLWFELNATDAAGNISTYNLQLELTEVIGNL